jgi:hypothetical protein
MFEHNLGPIIPHLLLKFQLPSYFSYMFAKIARKPAFLSLKSVFRPLKMVPDEKGPLFRNRHHLLSLKIEFSKIFIFLMREGRNFKDFWKIDFLVQFFTGITLNQLFFHKKVGNGSKIGPKVRKSDFFQHLCKPYKE